MSVFKLQQFSITQHASAMKVCSDSLLFGAMAPIKPLVKGLDIGAGTGLLALMAMQLGASNITAVELTADAADEASGNVKNSPWPENIQVINQDIIAFADQQNNDLPDNDQRYDFIISNPPFFEQHLKSQDKLRATARHTDSLPFTTLLAICGKLLKQQGLCYLLIPVAAINNIVLIAKDHDLHLTHQRMIIGKEGVSAKVAALTFIKQPAGPAKSIVTDQITIYQKTGGYTAQSTQYLTPFLLRFGKSQSK